MVPQRSLRGWWRCLAAATALLGVMRAHLKARPQEPGGLRQAMRQEMISFFPRCGFAHVLSLEGTCQVRSAMIAAANGRGAEERNSGDPKLGGMVCGQIEAQDRTWLERFDLARGYTRGRQLKSGPYFGVAEVFENSLPGLKSVAAWARQVAKKPVENGIRNDRRESEVEKAAGRWHADLKA